MRGGQLRRFIVIEKMRQTNHSRYLYEIDIKPGIGMTILGRVRRRVEDYKLPSEVMKKILEAKLRSEEELL